MKCNLAFLVLIIISTFASAQSARETLSSEAPNVITWMQVGLNQSVPSNIRMNLTYLREDLLDEGRANPKANPTTFELGRQLCNALIATLDEHDQAAIRAGYRAAQADSNTIVTSQALEARRNYKMSWPQYAREKDQRGEIQRQQNNNTTLIKESVKVEWASRVSTLRSYIDTIYIKYRDALRQDPTFQKFEVKKPNPSKESLLEGSDKTPANITGKDLTRTSEPHLFNLLKIGYDKGGLLQGGKPAYGISNPKEGVLELTYDLPDDLRKCQMTLTLRIKTQNDPYAGSKGTICLTYQGIILAKQVGVTRNNWISFEFPANKLSSSALKCLKIHKEGGDWLFLARVNDSPVAQLSGMPCGCLGCSSFALKVRPAP